MAGIRFKPDRAAFVRVCVTYDQYQSEEHLLAGVCAESYGAVRGEQTELGRRPFEIAARTGEQNRARNEFFRSGPYPVVE